MPPNLLVKAAFVRGELDNFGNSTDDKEHIRTDFILQNAFSCVIQDSYEFAAISAKNKNEEHVLKTLEGTINAFRSSYRDNIKNLCLELDVSEDTIGGVIAGVSNELFSEGITWSRLIAFFVFVGELAQLCLSRKFPPRIVDRIYDCFYNLVNENLLCWVNDHNGWEGLLTLAIKKSGGTKSVESSNTSNSGWAKSLLYGTVRMVGTLAQIANSSSPSLP